MEELFCGDLEDGLAAVPDREEAAFMFDIKG